MSFDPSQPSSLVQICRIKTRLRRNTHQPELDQEDEEISDINDENDNVDHHDNVDQHDINDNTQQPQENKRRRVLKVIKRKPKLLSEDLTEDHDHEDHLDDHHHDDHHKNFQDQPRLRASPSEDSVKSEHPQNPISSNKPVRRRIAITRKRPVAPVTLSEKFYTPVTLSESFYTLDPTSYYDPSSSSSTDEEEVAPSIAPSPTTKRRKFVLKTKKRLIQEEAPILETSTPILELYNTKPTTFEIITTPILFTTETYLLDTITTTTTRKRTYTFVVTRVNDGESVVMSSTSVKDHVGPSTQTVTRTISLTITIPPLQQLQTKSYV